MRSLKKYSEAVFIGLLTLYALAGIWNAFGIAGVQQPGEILTPRMYVLILAVIFAGLGLANLFLSVRRQKNAVSEQTPKSTTSDRTGTLKMILMMLLGLLFVLGMKTVGFYSAAFLVVAVGYLIIEGLGKKNVVTAVVFAAVVCMVFLFVFRQFHIYLPQSALEKLIG